MKFSEDSILLIGLALFSFALGTLLATKTDDKLKEVDKVMQECEDSLIETNAPRNSKCDLVLSYKITSN